MGNQLSCMGDGGWLTIDTSIVLTGKNLNIDGALISARACIQPSYSQTSRLLSTSLSLDTTFPCSTQ
jgi:hypothetical protein